MIVIPASADIRNRIDLRFNSEHVILGENITFDDDVRIVVPANGRLSIGNNVKIGKGTVINCGGTVSIGNDVSFYGYCYVQSSSWTWVGDQKKYDYFTVKIADRASFAPNTTISGETFVQAGYRSRPGEIIGQW